MWNRCYSDDVFFWDWKQKPNDDAENSPDFFKKLDEQLKGSGRQVVHIEFDGDAYPWFIGPRNEERIGNPVTSQLRIDHDDGVLEWMENTAEALRPHGVTFEDDGEEHDGWIIMNIGSIR